MIAREAITGLVLCGGRGSRMGGLDKGLQTYRGQPLAARALDRLRPQVGSLMISANRHLDLYAQWGIPVVCDSLPDHPGPLAGLLTGLEHCTTEWLACVPCDAPWFPLDLVDRLARAAHEQTTMCAVALTAPSGQMQPVFGLVHTALRNELRKTLAQGLLKAGQWWRTQRAALAEFDESISRQEGDTPATGGLSPFDNLNTLSDLHR